MSSQSIPKPIAHQFNECYENDEMKSVYIEWEQDINKKCLCVCIVFVYLFEMLSSAAQMFQQFRLPFFLGLCPNNNPQTVEELSLKGMKYCIGFSGKKMPRVKDVIKLKRKRRKWKKNTHTEIKSIHFVLFHFSSFTSKRIEQFIC